MEKGILGTKIGMTQIFTEEGLAIPVTVIEAGPCTVIQKKVTETDGYNAVKVSFGKIKEKNVNKPAKGEFKKANAEVARHMRELRIESVDGYNVGDQIKADVFQIGDKVDVFGVSKGKGFQSTIKRYNGHRGPMGHGSMYHRRPGSMGQHTNPGRVFKGKKLPGHMGSVNVTVLNLDIIRVDAERNLILIKGAVPGPKGGLLMIKDSIKSSK